MKPRFVMAMALGGAVSACGTHSKPNTIYMPDMVWSQSVKAQEEGSMRMPVAGTVPRGFQPYPFKTNPEGAGKELRNPLENTQAVLGRGKALFETYCVVCHGPGGEGDGSIIPKFPKPPSLHNDKVRGWPDGRIYHVLSAGQGLMPSYASQVSVEDRWAVVHYLRALQRAKNPRSSSSAARNSIDHRSGG